MAVAFRVFVNPMFFEKLVLHAQEWRSGQKYMPAGFVKILAQIGVICVKNPKTVKYPPNGVDHLEYHHPTILIVHDCERQLVPGVALTSTVEFVSDSMVTGKKARVVYNPDYKSSSLIDDRQLDFFAEAS